MKLINKDFDFETFDNFGISKLVCDVSYNDTNYTIIISDNNCDGYFRVCEYENDDVDDDVIELFENSDFYDDLIDYANQEQNEYLDNLLSDFENEFNSKYELEYKDNIYLCDFQKQIFKNKENDYILKIQHIGDSSLDEYYQINNNDFEVGDNDDDNIIIEVNESFDFDNNKISIFEIGKL